MFHFKNLAATAVALLLLAAPAQAETIPPAEARDHIGSVMTVEGVVSQVSISKSNTTFINFGGRYPNQVFYAVIFRDNATRFAGVSSLEGKTVAVTGAIDLYKGRPQIIVADPDQIEVR